MERSRSCPSLSEKDTEVQSGSRVHSRGWSLKADLWWIGFGSRELMRLQSWVLTREKEEEERE